MQTAMFVNCLLSRYFCKKPPVAIYQNLYASKPSVRNRIKVDNFQNYEDLGRIKQHVFREHSDEAGLGPIPTVDECAKTGTYKNPEYFSYHNYTYYDFEVGVQCWHLPQPSAIEDNDRTSVLKRCLEPIQSDQCCPPPPPSCSLERIIQNAADADKENDTSPINKEVTCTKSSDETSTTQSVEQGSEKKDSLQ